MKTAQSIAEPNTILRATVGSTLHGLALEGTDDRDEMGICLEGPEAVIGLHKFEQWVFRTKPEGVPSGPGDLDLTIFSARKWARLALQGNPTVLLLLYAPEEFQHVCELPGAELQSAAWAFASRRAGPRFLGYLTAQRDRLLGLRGQKRTKRPELEIAHGYDTKYAMHMLRLGFQGVEFLKTGRITLPMPEEERVFCMRVRTGGSDLQEVLTKTGELEAELEDLLETSPLPADPDRGYVDSLLIKMYRGWWMR